MLLASFAAIAQTPVNFDIQRGGFCSSTGEDFVVVPMENTSAHTIFQTIYANVVPMVKDGQKQITVVDDAMIKVTLPTFVAAKRQLITKYNFFGMIVLEFKIKDGRVRVAAPYFEGLLDGEPAEIMGSSIPCVPISFNDILSDWFEKNGKPKQKKVDEISAFTGKVNYAVNTALGLTSDKKKEENW